MKKLILVLSLVLFNFELAESQSQTPTLQRTWDIRNRGTELTGVGFNIANRNMGAHVFTWSLQQGTITGCTLAVESSPDNKVWTEQFAAECITGGTSDYLIFTSNFIRVRATTWTGEANTPILTVAYNGYLIPPTDIATITTAPLNNQRINERRYCNQFSGANAGIKLQTCIDDLPATGGIADATGFLGIGHIITENITVTTPTKVLFGKATFVYSGIGAAISLQAEGSGIECESNASSIIHITGAASDGIIPEANNTFIKNCTIRGPNNNVQASGWSAIDSGLRSGVEISGNIIEGWDSHCINTGGSAAKWKILNNTIRDCFQDGVLHGGDGHFTAGNFITNTGSWALDLNGSNNALIGNYMDDVGNGSFGGDQGGIAIFSGSGINSSNNRIIGNDIANHGGRGIHIASAASTNNNIIEANNIFAGTGGGYGILVNANMGFETLSNKITNNIIRGYDAMNEAGIFLQNTNGTVSGTDIRGNTSTNNYWGVVIDAGILKSRVQDNDLTSNSAAATLIVTPTEVIDICNRINTTDNLCRFTSPISAIGTIQSPSGGITRITSTENTAIQLDSTQVGTGSYSFVIFPTNSACIFNVVGAECELTFNNSDQVVFDNHLNIPTGVIFIGTDPPTSGKINLSNSNPIAWMDSDGTTNRDILLVDNTDQTLLRGAGGTKTIVVQNAAATQIAEFNETGGLTIEGSTDPFLTIGGTLFANLGTPGNGRIKYCSNCQVTSGADNTCTSGGNGAIAIRLNSVWRCLANQN